MDINRFNDVCDCSDLLININDDTGNTEKLYLIKNIVCNKSGFIRMLVKRQQELSNKKWPPINEISITLPDNIPIIAFKYSMCYLYDDKHQTPIELMDNFISCLMYILIDDEKMLTIIRNYLPDDRFLNDQECQLLINAYDQLKDKTINLLRFYYLDLKKNGYLDTDDEEIFTDKKLLRFGDEISHNLLSKDDKINPSFDSIDRIWVHIPSDKIPKNLHEQSKFSNVKFTFDAFGVKFIMTKYIDGYSDEAINIFVDEDFRYENEPFTIKLRITIIFFLQTQGNYNLIEVHSTKEPVYPDKLKISEIIYNNNGPFQFDDKSWSFDANKKYRMSILLERLE